MLKFTYNPQKATQAAGYVLSIHNGKMNYTKLIKLLYLADRESLRRYCEPITTDSPYSMDNGPILSHILDHITRPLANYWYEFIERIGYDVKLKKRIPLSELSRSELEILDEIYQQFGSLDVWDLVAYCHKNLPEWQDPEGSSIPISFEEILNVLGKSKNEIARVEEETKFFEAIKSTLSAE